MMRSLRWCVVATFVVAVLGVGEIAGMGNSSQMSAAERDALLHSINAERKKHDLPPLRLNAAMDAQAQEWANHLLKIGKMVHGGFKGDHAQCIASGQQSPQAACKAWMSDAPHRKCLLDKNHHQIGLGRAGRFWVANFK